VVAIVFSVMGGIISFAVTTHINRNQTVSVQSQTTNQSMETDGEFKVYGAYDDRCFTQEISLDWASGDLDFQPLDCDLDKDIQEFTFYLCAGYNIDFSLVMALISCESNYDQSVVSSTNDYGLMQINKVNHEELTDILGVTDFLDPYQNIRAGCFILRKLFEKYQDTTMVLMCYNMGETGAARLWSEGVYETNYTQKILAVQKQYIEELGW
jgi:hypothetical protein